MYNILCLCSTALWRLHGMVSTMRCILCNKKFISSEVEKDADIVDMANDNGAA